MTAAADADRVPDALSGMRIIDAHVHLFPAPVFAAIQRWFDRHAWPIRYRMTAEHVLQYLLDRGVSQVVGLAYAHVPGMAASLNQFMADLARHEPRLIGCATVLPGEPGAREILDEALGPLGLRGVKVHCHVQQMAPDDPRMDDVFAAAAEHRVPVVIHAGDAPASPHYGCDVEAICTPENFGRALKRHPRTTVVLPHLGADWMEQAGRMLGEHDNLYLDTTMALARYFPADPMTGGDPAEQPRWLERAVGVVRAWPGRILYGTDFPNVPYAWDRELRVIAELGLGDDELPDLLGGVAGRVFA